jgi:phosphatidyl-myo-inositol alpha-mannosyltransferase
MPWVRRRIPNGVDLSSFSPGEKSIHPTILFVGTFGQRKRGRLLADVFETEIRPTLPAAELWMVAEDAPEADGIRVLKRIPESELQELYRRAWVFCLPSTYEGFGIPYIEAMASGTPIVATPNAGAVEVTEAGRFGLLTDAGRLGSTLLRLLSSSADRDQLSAAALAHVQQFDLRRVAQQYEDLYVDLIQSSN